MIDLARDAHRVQRALEWLARDLDEDEPSTRRHDRDIAGMLRQLAQQLEQALNTALPADTQEENGHAS
jgi:uncharacterized protein YukE